MSKIVPRTTGDMAALTAFLDFMRQREEDPDAREKEAAPPANMLGDDAQDVLRLNITGTRMHILRRTLTSIEGSMLASSFSGRWDDGLPKDSEGHFFINQPYELWRALMDYLLDKDCETPLTSPVSSPTFQDTTLRGRFYRMIEYYQMTLGVYPFHVYELKSTQGFGPMVGCHPDYTASSRNRLTSFAVAKSNDHKRSIKSFEVTLDEFVGAAVGWSVIGGNDVYMDYPEGRGVGYASNSIAFDCAKSSIVYKAGGYAATCVTTQIPMVAVATGAVIRCEDYGRKWFINSDLIATTMEQVEGIRHIPNWQVNATYVPFISIQGSFKVSKIELDFAT